MGPVASARSSSHWPLSRALSLQFRWRIALHRLLRLRGTGKAPQCDCQGRGGLVVVYQCSYVPARGGNCPLWVADVRGASPA
eukprot:12925741-Prorocentrum_lima.AAC.1